MSGFLVSHQAELQLLQEHRDVEHDPGLTLSGGLPPVKLFLLLLLHLAACAKAFGACGAENGLIPNLPMPN